MNSNLDLATRILNDFVTTGDPAALAAVCDLIEELNPAAGGRVRDLADAIPAGVELYWCSEAADLVYAVLLALEATGAGLDVAVQAVYSATLEVV